MLKQNILQVLKKEKGVSISGGQLGAMFHVSRTAIWKAIGTLKEEGYHIVSFQNSGYALMSDGDVMNKEDILHHLKTDFIGRSMEIFDTLPSTNVHMKTLLGTTLPNGFTLIARQQTHGRGRKKTTFSSPIKKGIYMSIYLETKKIVDFANLLPLIAAVSVCRGIEELCGVCPAIAYPSDILLDGKKICGILTEVTLETESMIMENCIMGIGVYVNAKQEDFLPEYMDKFTSILLATGTHYQRSMLAANILNNLELFYTQFENNGSGVILTAYKKYLMGIGMEQIVTIRGKTKTVTIKNIDIYGNLVGRDGENKTVKIPPSAIQQQYPQKESLL